MCILADALLEDFFDSDLTKSWRLEVLVPEEKPKPQTIAGGWLRGIVSAVVTDENKVRQLRSQHRGGCRRARPAHFLVGQDVELTRSMTSCRSASTGSPTRSASASTSKRSSSVRRFSLPLGILVRYNLQLTLTISAGPSIGKLDAAAAAIEPTARDSLFSTSTSRAKPPSSTVGSSTASAAEPVNPLSAAAMRMPAYPSASSTASYAPAENNPWSDAHSSTAAGDIDVQALAQAAMQRPQFAVDEATEGDGGEEYGGEGELLGAVDAMLEDDDAHAGDGASPLSLRRLSIMFELSLADSVLSLRAQLCERSCMQEAVRATDAALRGEPGGRACSICELAGSLASLCAWSS